MKALLDLLNNWQKALSFSRASSWQTMIFLSLFSWFMAFLSIVFALATSPTSKTIATEFLSNMGWIFLIIGFHLWTLKLDLVISGFPIGSWLTGALVCLLVFGWWLENLTAQYPSLPFISWPLLSSGIAVWHKLQLARLNPRIPRLTTLQEIVVLCLINIIISCWLNFHFVVQSWLQSYPSLRADNFERSAFILKIESGSEETSRGVQMLDEIAQFLKSQIDNKPWSEVQNWVSDIPKQLNNKTWPEVRTRLLKLARSQEKIENQIKINFPQIIEEDYQWYINAIIEGQVNYKLVLKATWRGPRSRAKMNEIIKPCQITQTFGPVSPQRSELPQLPVATGAMKC